jgi:hypothetical protein
MGERKGEERGEDERRRRSGIWVREREKKEGKMRGGEGVEYGCEREKKEGKVREAEMEWNMGEKGKKEGWVSEI